MGDGARDKVYAIPPGYVSADPARNRYIRRRGTSMELPPRLNPDYGSDISDPENGVDWVGVATDLGKIGLDAVAGVAAGPLSIPLIMGSEAKIGLDTLDELRSSDPRRKK